MNPNRAAYYSQTPENEKSDSNPFILAAEGYAAIKMFREAHHQLDLADQLSEWRMTVALMRLDLFVKEHRWDEASIYGELMCELDPDEPDHFKKYATALHARGESDQALWLLREQAETFHYETCIVSHRSGHRL